MALLDASLERFEIENKIFCYSIDSEVIFKVLWKLRSSKIIFKWLNIKSIKQIYCEIQRF